MKIRTVQTCPSRRPNTARKKLTTMNPRWSVKITKHPPALFAVKRRSKS